MLGVWSGFTEEEIDDFSYKFYKGCMLELSLRFNFDSMKGIIGNSYASDAGKILQDINPLNYQDISKPKKSNLPRVTKDMMLALMDKEPKK